MTSTRIAITQAPTVTSHEMRARSTDLFWPRRPRNAVAPPGEPSAETKNPRRLSAQHPPRSNPHPAGTDGDSLAISVGIPREIATKRALGPENHRARPPGEPSPRPRPRTA